MLDEGAVLVAAGDFGGGAGGFVVTMSLFAVAIVLFAALSGSLKRMRSNVARGEFAGERSRDEVRGPRRPGPSDSDQDGGPTASPAPGESQPAIPNQPPSSE